MHSHLNKWFQINATIYVVITPTVDSLEETIPVAPKQMIPRVTMER